MRKFYFLILILFGACQANLDPVQYLNWSKTNRKVGFSSATTPNYKVEIQYQPRELVFLQRGGADLDDFQKIALWKEIDQMEYYKLDLFPVPGLEINHQDQYYFSYRFAEDIILEKSGVRQNPDLFHYERSNALSSKKTFVLAFQKIAPTKAGAAKILIQNDRIAPSSLELEINTNKFPKLKL
ncbi:hypothetical protein [Litoribacter populi]|uniref:hypothetical protein n=1 Tax=Litoribacter populi TaxID=2598460 RepID=UPI00118099EB|nr:hypothetical protein [Litoribacter populi]